VVQIRFVPRTLAKLFGGTVAALFAIHSVLQVTRFATGNERLFGLAPLFNLGIDGNVPTFYSGQALFFCAVLLALISYATWRSRAADGIYWLGLTAVFTFLAMDELLELHERLIQPVREAMNAEGLLYYAWVIPYGIAAIAFAALYSRFLYRLPRKTAVRFVVAGALFVLGAVGMEMLGGSYFESFGANNPGYVLLQTVEEGLEMFAIVLFIYALADHISDRFGELTVQITPRSGPQPPVDNALSARRS